ncbi:MAG: urease subunit alpha, partial [Pseudomonadota bacterium]
MARISRAAYAQMYGPTTGDRMRLGDTLLWAEIERDLIREAGGAGDELTTGAGKSMRDGEGFCVKATDAAGALDLVIHNATIIDATLGILKADIGIRRGRIAGLGKAGNPDIMAGVDPRLVTGPNTTVINGEHLIATPGAIEAHAHFLCPQ